MSKVLKIRVGRSGKKKKEKKKGRSSYNRVSNFFICDRKAANAMGRSTNMCTWCSWDTFPSVLFFTLFIQKIVQIWKMLNSQAPTKTNYSDFFLFISFKMQYSEEKKAPLDRVGRKVKKKKIFFFLGSVPKIGSVGTWETDNQIDVPLAQKSSLDLASRLAWSTYKRAASWKLPLIALQFLHAPCFS